MALINLVELLFNLLYLLLLVRVILSWVPGAMDHPAGAMVFRMTDPLLTPIRRLMPSLGGLDLSPLIAFLLLAVLRQVVLQVLTALVF